MGKGRGEVWHSGVGQKGWGGRGLGLHARGGAGRGCGVGCGGGEFKQFKGLV